MRNPFWSPESHQEGSDPADQQNHRPLPIESVLFHGLAPASDMSPYGKKGTKRFFVPSDAGQYRASGGDFGLWRHGDGASRRGKLHHGGRRGRAGLPPLRRDARGVRPLFLSL